MPPSILSSEALVIWMFRIAMNAPIMAANTAIQTAVLARPGPAAALGDDWLVARTTGVVAERARADMASPLGSDGVSDFRCHSLARRIDLLLKRFDGRDHRHAGTQFDRGIVERDLHGDALNHLGEIAGGVVRRQQREFLAAGRRERVDMAVHHLAGEHVERDR